MKLDIDCVVILLSKQNSNPKANHIEAIKKLVQYLKKKYNQD